MANNTEIVIIRRRPVINAGVPTERTVANKTTFVSYTERNEEAPVRRNPPEKKQELPILDEREMSLSAATFLRHLIEDDGGYATIITEFNAGKKEYTIRLHRVGKTYKSLSTAVLKGMTTL